MKNILIIATFFIAFTVVGQTSNSVTVEKQKLKKALLYGDQTVAANAMYNIIALEGEKSVYVDSLAYLYFNSRNYLSCFLVSEDALKNNPDNVRMLGVSAFSLESLGAKDNAIEKYQELLDKTQDNYHAYKIAVLQFELKKFDEALVSIKAADKLTDKGIEEVAFQINKKYNQSVPLKAAIAYLEGLITLSLDKKIDAKVSFSRAVQLFPDFILAKERLANLDVKPKE